MAEDTLIEATFSRDSAPIVRVLEGEELAERQREDAANAASLLEQEIDAEAKRKIRRQARRGLALLDTDITRLADSGQGLTLAQARPIILRQARISRGIIEALVSLGLLEEDAPA